MSKPIFDSYDIAEALEAYIDALPTGETVEFPAGKFRISRKIRVKNKQNLTLRGNGTTLISDFDVAEGFEAYRGIFDFTGCVGLTLENLIFDTDVPVNSAGVVTAVDAEKNTFDVKMYPDCALSGTQVIRAMNSMDENGSPDYLLASYKKTPYEMLDGETARIFCDAALHDSVARLPIGERICFRHALGNFMILENSAITFHDCTDILIRDITVYSSAGYMIVVFPRCHNMTLIRYRVVCPEGSNRLMASNIDAIHLFGLSGKLSVQDCYFDGLGDDALNIHSTAGFITAGEGNTLTLINKRFEIPLGDNWCRAGDVIAVYSPEFECRGHLRAESFEGCTLTFTLLDGSWQVGDVVGNTAFYAETEIVGCTVRNSRARGILLQTENITVRDCHFFGISRSAIWLSPDIIRWHEVGPVKNALIENCVFENTPASKTDAMTAAILVKTDHWPLSEPGNVYGVHENITVRNNVFKNLTADAIYMASTDGVTIEDNRIETDGEVQGDIETSITLQNCTRVQIKQGK